MTLFHADGLLASYLHGELSPRDRESVERHLARCARCRLAVEQLRAVGAALPALPTYPAPASLWTRVEAGLERGEPSPAQATDRPGSVRRPERGTAPIAATGSGLSAASRNGQGRPAMRAQGPVARLRLRVAVGLASVAVAAAAGMGGWVVWRQRAPYWEVRTLAGRPRVGWFAIGSRGRLRLGDRLTTDLASRAEIEVADIGTVKIGPNSRVRLTATGKARHSLDLEQGALEARVSAPPRLFVVETGSGRAVDLGCAYRLETAASGATILRVTLGEVALEDAGRSSLVPAGFSCESRRGAGLGTPVGDDAKPALRDAVRRFDFVAGGDAAADEARRIAGPRDAITLWHLLRRTSVEERGRLFDTLARLAPPGPSVRREGLLRGDPKMLDVWKQTILYDLAESEPDR